MMCWLRVIGAGLGPEGPSQLIANNDAPGPDLHPGLGRLVWSG